MKKNTRTINETGKLVGLFVSAGETAENKQGAIEKYLIKVIDDVGLNTGDNLIYDSFGGVYDLTEKSKLNWFFKRTMSMAADEDPNFARGERTDQRDWDQINEFIMDFMRKIN